MACARICQIDIAGIQMLHRFTTAQVFDDGAAQGLCDLWGRHNNGAAAIRNNAAIKAMQRVRDQWRVHHILDRYNVTQHGVFVILGVGGGRDLDPSKLFRRGAKLMHVPHGGHGIHIDDGRAKRGFEANIWSIGVIDTRRCARGHAFRAWTASQSD